MEEKSHTLALRRRLSSRSSIPIPWRISGVLPDCLPKGGREPENPRLVGCAGSPKPTCLSLQFGGKQGDFAKLQGQRRLIPAEGPRISMGWIGLSLIQGAGRPLFHRREGRFRNTAPVFFGDIHTAQFNVRFRAPFGHRRHCPLMSPTDPKRTHTAFPTEHRFSGRELMIGCRCERESILGYSRYLQGGLPGSRKGH